MKTHRKNPTLTLPASREGTQYGSVKIAFTVNGEAIGTKPAKAGFVCVAPGFSLWA
jgi:hypothetical protein